MNTLPAVPSHPQSEAWIEAGHKSNTGAELRLSFSGALPTGHEPFWIPLSAPDGTALGWMQFSYLTTVREQSQFAASAWRSATEPAPLEVSLLPLPIDSLMEGFAPHNEDPVTDELKAAFEYAFNGHYLGSTVDAFTEFKRQAASCSLSSLQAAGKIISFVRQHFPETRDCNHLDALWLAFQGLAGPAVAAQALERYRVITPSN